MKFTKYKDMKLDNISSKPSRGMTFPQRQVLAIIINYKSQHGKYPSIRKIAEILSSINRISISSTSTYERILRLAKKGYVTKINGKFIPTIGAMDKIFNEIINKKDSN